MLMKKRSLRVCFALFCTLFLSVCFANQPYTIGAQYGVNFVSDYDFNSQTLDPKTKGTSSFSPGFFTQASLARQIYPWYVIQLSAEYQSNNTRAAQLPSGENITLYGNWSSYSLLAISILQPVSPKRVSPYFGVGLGASYMDAYTKGEDVNFYIDDHSVYFVWQVEAGIKTRINERLSVVTQVQFFDIDVTHENTNSNQPRQYQNTAVTIGLNYQV